jgi:ribose transport system permease protein
METEIGQAEATAAGAGAAAGSTTGPTRSRQLLETGRDYGILVAFAALFITLSIASGPFLTWSNLSNILDQNTGVGIIAVGSTLVFIAGGFDLSVGAVYSISGVAASLLAVHIGPGGALFIGMLLGLGAGIVNGLLTTVGRINPFVATLATSIMIGGFALVMTGGAYELVPDPSFSILGRGGIGHLKYTIIVWFVFTAMCAVLLHRTRFGRYIYAAGGNAEAAKLSGVRVGLVRGICFAICGLSAGLAGILLVSQTATGQADAGGLDLAVLAVAGVVVGGTSILGGEGAVWRTVLGVLLLALIGNGFDLLGINPTYQDIIRGAIIMAAVGLDAWARRQAA